MLGSTAATRNAALRRLCLAVLRSHAVVSLPVRPCAPSRAWSCCPVSNRQFTQRGCRISHVPGEPRLRLCPAHRPRWVRSCQAIATMCGVTLALTTAKAPTRYQLSRLNHTASTLAAGTMPRMVGFVARVTPLPCKTRFRPLARRYRTGFSCRVPLKGFRFVSLHPFLLSQAFMAQGQVWLICFREKVVEMQSGLVTLGLVQSQAQDVFDDF